MQDRFLGALSLAVSNKGLVLPLVVIQVVAPLALIGIWRACHNGGIDLLQSTRLYRRRESRGGFFVACIDHHAANGAVKAVHGKDVAADRLAQKRGHRLLARLLLGKHAAGLHGNDDILVTM